MLRVACNRVCKDGELKTSHRSELCFQNYHPCIVRTRYIHNCRVVMETVLVISARLQVKSAELFPEAFCANVETSGIDF